MSSSWLVVNADDFGVSRGSTLGVIKAHREGIVTSASLAVTTPYYDFAVESLRKCPDLGIGLHFTLTSGRPVTDARRVPLLVNKKGFFRFTFTTLLVAMQLEPEGLAEQVDMELEAQFEKLKKDGIQPDHVNGERHVHLIPGIHEMVATVAKEYGVTYMRAPLFDAGRSLLRPADVPALVLNGGFVKSLLLTDLGGDASSPHMSTPYRVASYLYTGRTSTFLPMLLASPPEHGVTEVMVHPGLPDEDRDLQIGSRGLERYLASADRRAELDACIAARGKTQGWTLTNYRQLAASRRA